MFFIAESFSKGFSNRMRKWSWYSWSASFRDSVHQFWANSEIIEKKRLFCYKKRLFFVSISGELSIYASKNVKAHDMI